jgi:uncharacterized protein (DUF4415 family)
MKSIASPSAKPRNGKKVSSLKASSKGVTASRSKRSYGKPSVEHPEADVKHIVKGIVRHGLKPVSPKLSSSLRVDTDELAWFKAQG